MICRHRNTSEPTLKWISLYESRAITEMKLTAEAQRTQSITERKKGGNIKSPFFHVLSAISAPLR